MNDKQEKKGLNISAKSFITAILVILALMILTYALTFIIPGGEYARTADESGNLIIDTQGGFTYVQGGIPFWKWLLSPILVLGSTGSGTLIAVIAFLLIIGAAFNALEKCGLMQYLLSRITAKFGKSKYKLMAVVMLFFMAMGSAVGSFEECVPMVPIVVALSVGLGWDAITGVAMSILAAGCGFAAGVCNPFTIGVAQGLAGLPMFSGIWLRIVAFILIYLLLLTFVMRHAKKVEQKAELTQIDVTRDPALDRGLISFCSIIGVGILLILSSTFITALQDYTTVIVCIMFLAAGIACPIICGVKGKRLIKTMFDGIVSILPAVAMILMASSIRYTLETSKVLDTILHACVTLTGKMPRFAVILFIYLIVLVMNFFIASGSAKAFLLIPLIVPIAGVFGISAQLCILAFAFGDGFSNVFYPTNPVLLISLGLADISYGKWVRWSIKFQLCNILLTSALLLFGLAIGYC